MPLPCSMAKPLKFNVFVPSLYVGEPSSPQVLARFRPVSVPPLVALIVSKSVMPLVTPVTEPVAGTASKPLPSALDNVTLAPLVCNNKVSLPAPPSTLPLTFELLPSVIASASLPPVTLPLTVALAPREMTSAPASPATFPPTVTPAATVIVSTPAFPVILPDRPALMANESSDDPPVRFSMLVKPLIFVASVPASAALTVKALPSSSPTIVSPPPPPFIAPLSVPAVANVKVSTPLPPVRFSMSENVPVKPATSPLFAPSIDQALAPSVLAILSSPPRPSILPASVAPVAKVKVSLPLPPVRFSKPITLPVTSVTVEPAPLIDHTFTPSVCCSVSVPVPASMLPVTEPPDPMTNVSAAVPPVRFSIESKSTTPAALMLPALAPVTLHVDTRSGPVKVSVPASPLNVYVPAPVFAFRLIVSLSAPALTVKSALNAGSSAFKLKTSC